MKDDDSASRNVLNYDRSNGRRLSTPTLFMALSVAASALHLALYVVLSFFAYLSVGEAGVPRPDGGFFSSVLHALAFPLLRLAWSRGVRAGAELLLLNSLCWGLAVAVLATAMRLWVRKTGHQ
jgi:hypothetical protein